MRIKVAVYAIGASMAMSGCASVDQSAGIAKSQKCTSSPCGVKVGKTPIIPIYIMPDPIYATTGTQIIWTLDDSTFPSGTYFHPTKGIEFASDSAQYFDCKAGDPQGMPRSYTCIDNAPSGPTPYKYTIRTKGPGTPGDSDPTVVNN
jgi:hypothetical protein